MSRKRLPSLPDVPLELDPKVRNWMQTVKEALEVRLGRRGDPGEAAVTFNNLVDLGFARVLTGIDPLTGLPRLEQLAGSGGGTGEGSLPNFGPPPKPTNFVALGVFGGIHLLWDRRLDRPDLTFTEVWRSDQPDLDTADFIGGSGGASYFDIIVLDQEVTFYYWVRHISITGREGPFSDMQAGTKPANTAYLIDNLSNAISSNEFVQILNDRIDLIDGSEQLNGSVNARIRDERVLREAADDGLAQDITTVQVNLENDIASVEQTLTASIDTLDGTVTDIGAQFTLALDVNGYISGYTTFNDGTTSAAVWRVDTFAIGSPGNPDFFPFIIDDGVVYIDTARIRDGSIESGMIGSITFGKITEPNGTPVTTLGGVLRADMIDVDNITVQSAMIADAAIITAKIANAAITNAKIANAAITTAKIADAAITNAKISNASITAAKIVDANITRAKIGDAAVDTLKIAGNAVTIPASAYTSGNIFLTLSNIVDPIWNTIQSVSMNPQGSPVMIMATCHFRRSGSGTTYSRFVISGIGVFGQMQVNQQVFNDFEVYDSFVSISFRTGSLSSIRTFSWQLLSNGSQAVARNRFLLAMSVRR